MTKTALRPSIPKMRKVELTVTSLRPKLSMEETNLVAHGGRLDREKVRGKGKGDRKVDEEE